MGHNIRGYVARKVDLVKLAASHRHAIVVDLNDGFGFLPLTEAFDDEVFSNVGTDEEPQSGSEVEHGGGESPDEAFAQGWMVEFPMAYIEKDYHGGIGNQYAIAWSKGEVIAGPEYSESAGAINRALAAIGASKTVLQDEFQFIGLQHHRYDEDFEPPDGHYRDPAYFEQEKAKYKIVTKTGLM